MFASTSAKSAHSSRRRESLREEGAFNQAHQFFDSVFCAGASRKCAKGRFDTRTRPTIRKPQRRQCFHRTSLHGLDAMPLCVGESVVGPDMTNNMSEFSMLLLGELAIMCDGENPEPSE
jgi:hypothetical protein